MFGRLMEIAFMALTDEYFLILIKVLAIILALRLAMKQIMGLKTPPGPWGIPGVGYLPFMPRNKPVPEALSDLGSTYGPIFTVQLGWHKTIVLNTVEVMEEAFKKDEITGRPPLYSLNLAVEGGQDMVSFIHGPKWKFNRKVGLRALSHLARSKRSTVEQSTHEGMNWLINRLKTLTGKPVSSDGLYISCTGAIISSLCFGHSADPSDPFFKRLSTITISLLSSKMLQVLDTFPYLYPFYYSQHQRNVDLLKEERAFILARIQEHLPDMDLENVADISSAVEKSVNECPDVEKMASGQNDESMRATTGDIFHAGYFTTAENMTWATLLLSQNPSVQEKLAKEIHAVVGRDRFPNYGEDLERLHYTKATVYEVLRYGSNVALGLPHMALKDTKVGGYDIPKGFMVISNIWATHFNPAVFPDPYSFKPERFLEEGRFSATEARKVNAFSVGKRRCLGEALAVQTLPIFLACVVQNFQVRLDPATTGNPALETNMMLTVQPGQHKIIFEERK